jgi:osmoprotectant transport system substrate-binding protein
MTTTAKQSWRPRRPWRALLALLGVVALVGAACGDDDDDGDGAAAEGPTIIVGAQDFPESQILAEIYAQALQNNGFDAQVQDIGGFRDLLFAAFESGDVNLAPEYLASELNFLEEGAATSDTEESLAALQPLLEDMGLVAFEPAEAQNVNVFVVTRATADELGLTTLSDLADHADDLSLGAPADCEENPFCIPFLQEEYGVDLSPGFVPLDTGLIPDSLTEGAIDVGIFFSTDPPLADENFVPLEDDRGGFGAENILPVGSQELVDAYGDDLVDVVNAVSAALTTDTLIELNTRNVVDREDPDAIAADWLDENDI